MNLLDALFLLAGSYRVAVLLEVEERVCFSLDFFCLVLLDFEEDFGDD